MNFFFKENFYSSILTMKTLCGWSKFPDYEQYAVRPVQQEMQHGISRDNEAQIHTKIMIWVFFFPRFNSLKVTSCNYWTVWCRSPTLYTFTQQIHSTAQLETIIKQKKEPQSVHIKTLAINRLILLNLSLILFCTDGLWMTITSTEVFREDPTRLQTEIM